MSTPRTRVLTIQLILALIGFISQGCKDDGQHDGDTDDVQDVIPDATDLPGEIPEDPGDVPEDTSDATEEDGTGDVTTLRGDFVYSGSRSFETVVPILFAAESCAEVFSPPLRDPSDLPTALACADECAHSPDGTIEPAVFDSPDPDRPLVVFAYALAPGGAVTVYGCSEEVPPIVEYETVSVDVVLEDAPATAASNYEIRHEFSMGNVLPTRVSPSEDPLLGDWCDILAAFFGDPGETIWYLLEPEAIDAGLVIPAGYGDVVADVLNSTLLHEAPDWMAHPSMVREDIESIFSDLGVQGTMTMAEYDIVDGAFLSPCAHEFDELSVQWRMPCVVSGGTPSGCLSSREAVSIGGLGILPLPETSWTGSVTPGTGSGSTVEIDSHDIDLPFGMLFLALVDWAIDELAGDPSGFRGFMRSIISTRIIQWYNDGRPPAEQVDPMGGCTSVGEVFERAAVEAGITVPGTSEIGEFICGDGLTWLREVASGFETEAWEPMPDNLRLSALCYLVDSDDDVEFDHVAGSETDVEIDCNWDAGFSWAGGPFEDVTASFRACRPSCD